MATNKLSCDLQRALDSLERKVISLNYDGYFTKNFFQEMKDLFGLVAAARVFFKPEITNKVHLYHSDPVWDETQLSNPLSKLIFSKTDSCSALFNQSYLCCSRTENEKCFKSMLTDYNAEEISHIIIIPIAQPKMKLSLFSNDGDLHGVIVLYSKIKCEKLKEILLLLADNCTFHKKIKDLFDENEEPECYGSSDPVDYTICPNCKWLDRCGDMKSSQIPSESKKNNRSNLDPEVVLQGLKVKFDQLMGHGLSVLILTYDAKKRILIYRAVDYLDYPPQKEDDTNAFMGEVAKLTKDLNYEEELKYLVQTFHGEGGKKITDEKEELLKAGFSSFLSQIEENSASIETFKEQSIDFVRLMFKYIVQRINTGTTRFLWKSFESFSISMAELKKKISQYSDLGVTTPKKGENLRDLCEYLFVLSNKEFLIVTPLGYMGQKLGIIFTQVENENKSDEKQFLRIAKEFSPLLFHSLQDQVYREALSLLKSKHPDEVIDILCSVLPISFNITAIVFRSANKNEEMYGFSSKDEGTVFKKLGGSDNSKKFICGTKKARDEFSGKKNTLTYMVTPLEYYGDVYSSLDSDDSKIRSRSRLLINIDANENFPESMSGVLDLHFDLSEYSLRRHAPDIVRELKHLIDLLFEAASQKMTVLQHATKSAINAIISRNHSHHIGSHVTPRTSLDQIKNRLFEIDPQFPTKKDDPWNVINDLRFRLDEYIQKKADFMAEIATEPIFTTISKPIFKDVLTDFIRNSLLMDNVGANEGVNFVSSETLLNCVNRLKIHFLRNENCVKVGLKEGLNGVTCNNLTMPYDTRGFEYNDITGKDVVVAWPGPLGEFALYSFLENYIRNAIKHNFYKLEDVDKRVNIFVNVVDLSENDGFREEYFKYELAQDRGYKPENEFYRLEIWDDISAPDAKDKLNKVIGQSIIDNEGTLKSEGWGLAEMKIMATLMRGSDDFLSMGKNLRLVTGERPIGDVETRECLVFQFALMRAKELAIIGGEKPAENDLNSKGIWYFPTFDEFKDSQSVGLSKAGYQIAIIGKESVEKLKDFSHLLPYRVIAEGECSNQVIRETGAVAVSGEDIKKIVFGENLGEIVSEEAGKPAKTIENSWWFWVQKLLQRKKQTDHCLAIFFQQCDSESPTKEWCEKAESLETYDFPKVVAIRLEGDGNDITPVIRSEEKHFFIYDRHFEGYHRLVGSEKVNRDVIGFHEVIDKGSKDFMPIYSSQPRLEMICRLLESASLNILILDERIAEIAYGEMDFSSENGKDEFLYGSRQRHIVNQWANIFIATHVILKGAELKPVHSSVENEYPSVYVRFWSACEEKEIEVVCCDKEGGERSIIGELDALIIHQGVAETLLKKVINPDSNDDSNNFKNQFKKFIDNLRKTIPYIVVDSGRGVPANMPAGEKFMPFSILKEYVMGKRISKYKLVEFLMSATRNDREEKR